MAGPRGVALTALPAASAPEAEPNARQRGEMSATEFAENVSD